MGGDRREETAEPSYIESWPDSDYMWQVGSERLQQTPETRCFMDLKHLICEDDFLPSLSNQNQQCTSLINYWFKNLKG